jgi:hypothetical protein
LWHLEYCNRCQLMIYRNRRKHSLSRAQYHNHIPFCQTSHWANLKSDFCITQVSFFFQTGLPCFYLTVLCVHLFYFTRI